MSLQGLTNREIEQMLFLSQLASLPNAPNARHHFQG